MIDIDHVTALIATEPEVCTELTGTLLTLPKPNGSALVIAANGFRSS